MHVKNNASAYFTEHRTISSACTVPFWRQNHWECFGEMLELDKEELYWARYFYNALDNMYRAFSVDSSGSKVYYCSRKMKRKGFRKSERSLGLECSPEGASKFNWIREQLLVGVEQLRTGSHWSQPCAHVVHAERKCLLSFRTLETKSRPLCL